MTWVGISPTYFCLHPDVVSVSIADLNPDIRAQARATLQVEAAFDTFEHLLDSDVDAIGIFTPPWTHADMAVRALEAGKHVLSACPAGLTLDELRRVVSAVESSGSMYMIAETSYYYSGAMFAREAWRDGRFGDFVYAAGEYYYRPHAYDFWMRDFYANMPPMLYPTHSTAMVISVTGRRFERATCVGTPGLHPDVIARKRRTEWQSNDVCNMTLLGQMSGGGACRINEMRNVGCRGELGSLFGTLGSLRQHSGQAVWSDGISPDVDLTTLWQEHPEQHPQSAAAARLPASYANQGMGHDGSHRFLADEFVRAVTQNRLPHNHVWAAAAYSAPGIVAWESLKQGSAWLPVPDFGSPCDGREHLEEGPLPTSLPNGSASALPGAMFAGR